jgi:cytochrome oxidase Cu insertion factor (SCO1/SenC/PrrC family)
VDASDSPGSPPLRFRRLPLLLLPFLAAAVATALYLALRPSHETSTPSSAPASDAPAATWPAGALRAPDFSLRDESGRPVSLATLRGRTVILTFIDPLCRDYCPTEAQHLNEVADAFPAASKPAIVAVSVNVYGNAQANLRLDGRKWKLVPEWTWAVGPKRQLARAWRAYHIQVLVSTTKVAGVIVHRIGHTEAAYVVDRNGFQRALFLWPYKAEAVVRTLRALAGTP